MKKILLIFGVIAFTFTSCGDKKKEEVKKEAEPIKVEETVKVAEETTTDAKSEQIALGEKLFTEKTCVACHQLDTKLIGPSIKDIVKIYDEKGANMVQFLKGNTEAIVDTDPGQVAIMKANLDGFVKDLTPEELQALTGYMRNAAK
jgi:cytochrome c